MPTNFNASITEAAPITDLPSVGERTANYAPTAEQSGVLAIIASGAADAALASRGFASTTVLQTGPLVSNAAAAPNAAAVVTAIAGFAPLQVGALASDAAKAPNAAAVVTAIAAVADATTLTSGGVSVTASSFAPPSITGALPQDQIDSIVAALVALGLATDGR